MFVRVCACLYERERYKQKEREREIEIRERESKKEITENIKNRNINVTRFLHTAQDEVCYKSLCSFGDPCSQVFEIRPR
jgi:hypothetical protein